MPFTHLSLHFHIVFSTKDLHPFIADDWRGRLHEYPGGLVRAADGIPEAIGGTADHVHLLVGLPATHSLATFVQDIKQTSSRWVHETIGVKNFAWQPGYGAFTVSVSNCDAVKEYIANQVEHHQTKTFQEEYVAFLQKHGVEYDGNICGKISQRPLRDANCFNDVNQPLRSWLISSCPFGTKRERIANRIYSISKI